MDPYAEQQPEENPRPRRGCLWGCLGTLIAAVVVIGAIYSYAAWYFYKGFADDPRIQTVMEQVKKSDEAAAVLGKNISVQSRESYSYDYATGRGGTATYVLKVIGSNGEGRINAELDIRDGKTKVTSLVLVDGTGRSHYLVGAAPANPMIQNSI
jgi:hypothetical protein